jgi:hypothetical protein
MKLKKVAVGLAGIVSIPAVVIGGSAFADFVYLRLAFQGYDLRDLSPGNGPGGIFLTWVFCGILLLFDVVFWIRIYRRVSN